MLQNPRAVAKALPIGVEASAAALGMKGLGKAAQPKTIRQRPAPRSTMVTLPQSSPPVYAVNQPRGLHSERGVPEATSTYEQVFQEKAVFTFDELLGQEPQSGRISAFSMAEKVSSFGEAFNATLH